MKCVQLSVAGSSYFHETHDFCLLFMEAGLPSMYPLDLNNIREIDRFKSNALRCYALVFCFSIHIFEHGTTFLYVYKSMKL